MVIPSLRPNVLGLKTGCASFGSDLRREVAPIVEESESYGQWPRTALGEPLNVALGIDSTIKPPKHQPRYTSTAIPATEVVASLISEARAGHDARAASKECDRWLESLYAVQRESRRGDRAINVISSLNNVSWRLLLEWPR